MQKIRGRKEETGMGSRKDGDSSLAKERFSLFGLIQPILLMAWLFPP